MGESPRIKRDAPATIYSIAQELGISASTVSRAFSRPQMVKESVRQRILETAARQGFQVNRTARGLATGKTGLIGVAVRDLTNPFVPPLVRAIDSVARSQDASVLLWDMQVNEPDVGAGLHRLSQQVDGLVVMAPRDQIEQFQEIAADKPMVVINQQIPGIASVCCDNTQALHAAANHLQELGHEQFLVLGGPKNSWAAGMRIAAMDEWAHNRNGVAMIEGGRWDATFEAGKQSAATVIDSGASAVFTFDDFFACGVVAGLAELGYEVPKDFSVVGCDDVLLARTLTPQLTTLRAPFEEIGQAAMDQLNQVMAGAGGQEVTLVGEFVKRGTTGPAPSKS